jgi:omega-amidase
MASSTASSEEPVALSLNSFRFAAIQMQCTADKLANLENAFQLIKQASTKGAHLICLPECFNSPYGTKYFEQYAEVVEEEVLAQLNRDSAAFSVPSNLSFKYDSKRPTFSMLSQAAASFGVYLIGGSFPERGGNGELYNTSLVFDPQGKRIATHRKVHLFDIDVPGKITFRESDALTAGNQVTVFDFDTSNTCAGISAPAPTQAVKTKIGVGICYDLRFPELAQIMSHTLGAKMLVYPGAFNMTTGPAHWKLLQQGRALDNQVFVATCSPSRDASAGYTAYGHSLVVNPWGVVVAELDENTSTLIADIDMDIVESTRSSIPIMKQKRHDMYTLVGPK